MLRTKVDRLAELVERKPITVAAAAQQLGAPADLIEFVARSLELEGVFQLSYPPVGSPTISLAKKIPFHEESLPASADDKYSFVVQGIPATVYIYRDAERRPFYDIVYPAPGPYTALFLETLKPDIARDVPLESSYFLTPERMQAYLPVIFDKVKQKLSMYFSEHLDAIAGSVFVSMYGMGELELLMGDDSLEEVAVNTSRLPISVYHRKYGWMKTNLTIPDEDTIANVAAQIARRVGQQITIADPVLDAFLTTGDRATATLYPASTRGNTITIRKFAREPWTSTKFIQGHTYSSAMAALLWQATHYEMNIVATGGTASGKCVVGNTRVLTTSGIRPIKEIVDEQLSQGTTVRTDDGFYTTPSDLAVYTFDPVTLRIKRALASRVWKRRAPSKLLRVKTQTGREITVTPEHPFFTLTDSVEAVRAEQLKIGDSIAAPRALPISPKIESLDLSALSSRYNVQRINGTLIAKGATNSIAVNVPERIGPALARLVGYIIGDGHIKKDRTAVLFFNEDKQLLDDFCEKANAVFGVTARIKQYRGTPYASISSRPVAHFFTEVLRIPQGNKSHSVEVPHQMITADEDSIKEFLIGLFESEASVDVKKSVLEFSTASKGLACGVQLILLRLNILSTLLTDKHRNRVNIGSLNLVEYGRRVGFISDSKRARLADAVRPPYSPNFDFVPAGPLIKQLKKTLRLYDRELAEAAGLSREAVTGYINTKRSASRQTLANIATFMRARRRRLIGLYDELKATKTADYSIVGSLIKRVRMALGTDRKEFAERAGVNVTTLWLIEGGETRPRTSTLTRIYSSLVRECSMLKDASSCVVVEDGAQAQLMSVKQFTGVESLLDELGEVVRCRRSSNSIICMIREELKLARYADEIEIETTLQRVVNPLTGCRIELLGRLATSSVLWDRIAEVKEIAADVADPWVYDLTVEDTHTFIANEMIVHNTSMLNTLMQLVPPFQRVVTIEETRELALPDHIWNWIPLLVRAGGPATEAERVKITMADLLKTSLRMRPDRIVLGEVRSPDEAKVLFDAMQTGHSVSTTFHADSANQLITRMLEPPFSIHTAEAESIHLVVVQHRDRRRNIRRTFEISEIVPSMEGSLSTNRLFIWRPRTDMFEAVNKPRRYVEDINIFTGMTEREINEDLAQRKSILDWMCGQGYYDISQVSEVARAYYSTLDTLLDAVAKNGKLEGMPEKPMSQRALFSSAAVTVPSTAPQPAKPMPVSEIPSVSFGALKEIKRDVILKKADEGKAGKGRLQPRKGQPSPKGGKRK